MLAACGSSDTSPTASAPSSTAASSSSSAPAADKVRASGLVATVSGGTVTLSGSKGAGTVDVSPSTHVTQIVPSQLTNLAVGDCVVVHPTKDGGAPPTVTAASVQFAVAKDGRCGHGKAVIGTVASITGNTVAVTEAAQPTVTVTVTPDTRYTSRTTATPAAIAVGQCLTARGTAGAAGDVQAAAVSIRPSDDGRCQGKQGG